MTRHEDIADFLDFLGGHGFDPEEFERVSANCDDQIGGRLARVQIEESAIEGVGVFATVDFESGEVVAPALIKGKRTPAGRFTNHAKAPNAIMRRARDGGIDLIATQPIQAGEEVTVNYRQVLELFH